MYKKFVIIAITCIVSIISCRNLDPNSNLGVEEQNVAVGGKTNVQVNLIGTSFGANSGTYGLSDSEPQTFVKEIAGNTLVAEITPTISPFSDIVRGENLPKDYPYRVFVFDQEDRALIDYKDFKVGEEKPASFTLDFNGNYIFIAYTDAVGKLPEFSVNTEEIENLTVDDITVDFEGADVMYFKLENYSPSKLGSVVNVTLMHRTSHLTLDVKQILYKDYVKDVSITPNYMSGIMKLSTGNIIERNESAEYKVSSEILTFNAPEGNVISRQIPINVTDTLTLKVKIKQNNEFNEIELPLKLDLGTKYTLSLKLKYNCGAYVSKELWREFMCHNLGANYDAHPINKITDLYGNKYLWGVKEPVSTHEEEVNNTTKVVPPIISEIDAWQDEFKTENDPCPNGYRVPTPSDFQGIIDYNKWEFLKTWNEKEKYLVKFGDDLVFPLAGYRYKSVYVDRNVWGVYWTSRSVKKGQSFRFSTRYINKTVLVYSFLYDFSIAFSVRCIKEDDNITARPGTPNVGTGWDKEGNIDIDIDKIIKKKKNKEK